MPKILILTTGFGSGHNSAAFGLRDALRSVAPDSQVEVLDLLRLSYGKTHEVVTRLFLGVVKHAPALWGGMYAVLDKTPLIERQMTRLSKPRETLRELLESTSPDALVSTYPAYSYVVNQLRQGPGHRRVPLITVVTDSITVHSSWHGAPSDAWVVPNAATARVMTRAGISRSRIHDLGFPVSPRFATLAARPPRPPPSADHPLRALYLIPRGKKRAGQAVDHLLEIPNLRLTIACGGDERLRARMLQRARPLGKRVRVLGWTDRMPDLLAAHHLAITKAGGAIIQECLAARCAPVVTQVVPGQEEGNARLVEDLRLGAVAKGDREMLVAVRRAATDQGKTWARWRRALERHGRPDAARHLAEFVLRAASQPEVAIPAPVSPRRPRLSPPRHPG